LTFIPKIHGKHNVHFLISEKPIYGSPLMFDVTPYDVNLIGRSHVTRSESGLSSVPIEISGLSPEDLLLGWLSAVVRNQKGKAVAQMEHS